MDLGASESAKRHHRTIFDQNWTHFRLRSTSIVQATHDRIWPAGEVGRSVPHFAHSRGPKNSVVRWGILRTQCASWVGDYV